MIDTDICIVGAGPAGLSLAHSLVGSGLGIVLIESGGRAGNAVRELNSGVRAGHPLADLRTSRARGIGGSATIWSTIRSGTAGAKYVPLDAIDFESREELPHGGWPIGFGDLESWYRKAYELLGLSPAAEQKSNQPRIAFGGVGLTTSLYQWAPASIFREAIPKSLGHDEHVTLLTNATVTELVGTSGGVTAVNWRSESGRNGVVRAKRFVLACGTIENARLLLASRLVSVAAAGWLGRGLMEHPIDRSMMLHSSHPALLEEQGRYAAFGAGGQPHRVGRIGCSAPFLRRHRLLNASLRLFRKRERRWRRVARKVSRWAGRPMTATWRVFTDLEQAPHPENRVTLSQQVDEFGMPRAAVDWRWRPEDEANRQRVLGAIATELSASGAGTIQVIPGVPIDPDAFHHAGTTRMSVSPWDGVVDSGLRVHGMENLWILGASVFPTCGVANPTLTIIALGLRLGATIRG